MRNTVRTETSIAHKDQAPSAWAGPFLTIWGGQAFSLVGSQLVQFVLVWYLTATTGSATVLAFATLVALLPQIFLSPVAGALVDRWNRRMVMMVADAGIALATVALAALFLIQAVQVWHIYLLMFIRAAGAAFHWPAMQASTSLLVPERQLSRVAGLNQTLWGLAGIVAPPLGALLLGLLPMQGILAIDVGTAMLAIGPLVFIAIPNPERKHGSQALDEKASVWADLRQGLRLVRRWPGLLMIIIIATLINLLLVPAISLMPILVTEHFGGGALQLAWMEAAWGIGMVLGGVLIGVWGGFKRRMVTALVGLIVMGAALTAVGLLPSTAFMLALAAFFLGGAMNPIVNGSVFAALQASVPADMQGRIFTLLLSGSAAMAPLSLAAAGPLADAFGVQIWFAVGGLLTVAMGVSSAFVPALLHFEEQGQKIAEQNGAQAPSGGESSALLPA
ncbi:MAG: MFS transporter [Anaerolineales bacterium]|nr:MAG: MFS transporter [Anaerolineales bacterium]